MDGRDLNRSDPHPGRLALERWFLGQRDDPEVGQHIAACHHCQAALAALEAERAAFLTQHPAESMLPPLDALHPLDAADAEAPSEESAGDAPAPADNVVPLFPRRVWLRRVAWAASLFIGLTALAGGLGWWLRGPGPAGRGDGPDLIGPGGGVRAMGRATLSALRMDPDETWVPLTGPAGAGDAIRLSVRLPRAGYPLVIGRQDDGRRGLLYPAWSQLEAQPRLPAGQGVVLPGALVLDDYAGGEEALLLLADTPWTRDGIAPLLRDADLDEVLARLALRAG